MSELKLFIKQVKNLLCYRSSKVKLRSWPTQCEKMQIFLLIQSYCVNFAHCVKKFFTVWKFQNFSANLIFREIKSGKYYASKPPILTGWQSLNLYLSNFKEWKNCTNSLKSKLKASENGQKGTFWVSIKLVSHKIWVTDKSLCKSQTAFKRCKYQNSASKCDKMADFAPLHYGPYYLRRFWIMFFYKFLRSMEQIFWSVHWAKYGLLEPHYDIWMKWTHFLIWVFFWWDPKNPCAPLTKWEFSNLLEMIGITFQLVKFNELNYVLSFSTQKCPVWMIKSWFGEVWLSYGLKIGTSDTILQRLSIVMDHYVGQCKQYISKFL